MIRVAYYNIINNKRFFFRLLLIIAGLYLLVSVAISIYLIYRKTIEKEEDKLLYDNYYISSSECSDFFSNVKYEKIDLMFVKEKFSICFKEKNWFSLKKNNFVVSNYNTTIPRNVEKSYQSHEVDYCFCGRLPTNHLELTIPYSLFINIVDTNNSKPVNYDDIIGNIIQLKKGNEVLVDDYVLVGVTNDIFFDYFDNVLINGFKAASEDNVLYETRYYISDFKNILEINKTIEKQSLSNVIHYKSFQYGYYQEINKFFSYTSTIYSSISIPLIIALLMLWLNSVLSFDKMHNQFGNIMKMYGCNFKQILTVLFNEIVVIDLFGFTISFFFVIPIFFALKFICYLVHVDLCYEFDIFLVANLFVVSFFLIIDIFTFLIILFKNRTKVTFKF